MQGKHWQVIKITALALLLIALMVYGFLANEARKEVRFLCGNFSTGVSHTSVIRQLNTANFADYRETASEQGSRIMFSSPINFRYFRCYIELDQYGDVTHADYE
ncbi:hypothetical protein JYB87_11010 [Shewanella avicenniae]|uniref:Uncharacterized protein n=1 Tax=Shewanella avicenniae TaxID=2814294 RepID=A0ABX7QLP7_9GAMM|nr:hypothetical protein [Shewanella avicenniae]QSX32304.1 hypothetical protein JYB87_11010 [Shewanella avicenniae]